MTNTTLVKCPECGISFFNQTGLSQHLDKMHRRVLTSKICNVCGSELPIDSFQLFKRNTPLGQVLLYRRGTCADCLASKRRITRVVRGEHL